MVDLLERIDVMLEQELRAYKTVDYLAPAFQKQLVSIFEAEGSGSPVATDLTVASNSSSSSSTINEVWREKICEWSYQVSREVRLSLWIWNVFQCAFFLLARGMRENSTFVDVAFSLAAGPFALVLVD